MCGRDTERMGGRVVVGALAVVGLLVLVRMAVHHRMQCCAQGHDGEHGMWRGHRGPWSGREHMWGRRRAMMEEWHHRAHEASAGDREGGSPPSHVAEPR